jgi:hypothetical protein
LTPTATPTSTPTATPTDTPNGDSIPDACSWNDINIPAEQTSGSTNTVTISGINQTITLRIEYGWSYSDYAHSFTIFKNGVGVFQDNTLQFEGGSSESTTISVVAGDTISFTISSSDPGRFVSGWQTGGNISVYNTSNNDSFLDGISYDFISN